MRYRKLTETNDYSFGRNNDDFIDKDYAVAQAIKTKILLFYGEWWEDLSLGIPMFQSIVGQKNMKNVEMAAQLLIEKRIKEVKEVLSIDKFVFSEDQNDHRKLIVEVFCTTIYKNQISVGVEL